MSTLAKMLWLAFVTLWQNSPPYRRRARKQLRAYQLEAKRLRLELADANRRADNERERARALLVESVTMQAKLDYLEAHHGYVWLVADEVTVEELP